MKRVYCSESLTEVGHLKNLLEQAGIACVIRNDQLCGALGEIPFLECLPELWVLNELQFRQAESLIGASRTEGLTAETWRCRYCGELNEGQFAACWRCAEPDTAE